MRKLSIWHWMIAVGLIAFVVFLGTGLYKAIAENGMGSGEAAGWVQAIGAILAIVVAFLVVDHQHRRHRTFEAERQRDTDVRRLKALKAVLTQICTLAKCLLDGIEDNNAEMLYDFDPQYLVDYKTILLGLPLFEIPTPQLAMQLTIMQRACDEVAGPMFKARMEANDDVLRYEFLLANDIEIRVERLYNLAADANNHCIDMLTSLNGYSPEELPATSNI